MTKEKFLIESQFLYYEYNNSEVIFNLLNEKVKIKVIKSKIKENDNLYDYELEWMIKHLPKLIKKWILTTLKEGEVLTEDELNLLDTEHKLLYYETIYKYCVEDDDLDDWNENFKSEYDLLKAKMRDEKIDKILND